jgi:hypothetical protein
LRKIAVSSLNSFFFFFFCPFFFSRAMLIDTAEEISRRIVITGCLSARCLSKETGRYRYVRTGQTRWKNEKRIQTRARARARVQTCKYLLLSKHLLNKEVLDKNTERHFSAKIRLARIIRRRFIHGCIHGE